MNPILLVDDKEENLYYLQTLLRAHGYQTETARNGEEALHKARRNLPGLVISDLLMPVIDGYTFLRIWKSDAHLSATPFIVYTATYTDPEDENLAFKFGADDFILKPTGPEEFISRVQEVLNKPEVHKPEPPETEGSGDKLLLQEYSETLIRKLEQKTLQLELANRELQSELEERKLAEAQIREQAALLDAANEAIYVQDLHDNRILFWNKGAERMYGWSSEHALGKSAIDLIFKTRSEYEDALNELQREDEWQGEFIHQSNAGKPIVIESNWTLLKDESGHPKSILAINSDITEKKNLENQFLRAQRMESIGTLAGGIAHDLNNMLAPILMAIELLSDTVKDPDGRALLNSMQKSALRGSGLVKQVLSFAKGVEGKRVAVDPTHIARELATVLRETFPKSITLCFDNGQEGWSVIGDPTQLHQVLLNLCVNARDAMPDGGKLCIHIQNKVLDKSSTATNINARPGKFVLFRISDTGMGMSQSVLNKMFEPFFTTKNIGNGTGLGLSTTLAIVQSHKGFMDVHSREGEGTTFDVYFPAEPDNLIRRENKPGASMLPKGNGEWILAVEDEPAIRKIIQQTLEKFGYRILVAENGKEAVRIYTEHQEKIALVLTDMAMPLMDGPTAIRHIKKMNPDVKVIMSSGFSEESDSDVEIRQRVNAFIPKPYPADLLLQTIHGVLQEG